jgi:hypothetical protein
MGVRRAGATKFRQTGQTGGERAYFAAKWHSSRGPGAPTLSLNPL